MDSLSQILFEHGSFSKISRIISDTFAKNGLLGHLLPIRCPDSMGYESIIAGGISCCLDRGVVGSFDLETSTSQSPILSLASEKKGGDIILVFDNIRCGKVVQAAIQIIQQKYGFNIIGIATINSPSTSKLCMIEFSSYYGNVPIISMFRAGKLEQQQLQEQQQINSFAMCDCHDVSKGTDTHQKQLQYNEHGIENDEYNNKSNVDDNAMDTDDSTTIAADDGTSNSKSIEGVDEVVVVLSEENSTISVVDFKEQDNNDVAASDVTKESIFLQSDSVPIENYGMEEVSSLSLTQSEPDKQQSSTSSLSAPAESGANNSKKDLNNVTQLMSSSSGDGNRLTVRHFASATVLHQTSHEFQSQTSSSTSSHSAINNLLMEQVENGPRYWIARVSANSPCEDAFVVSHCNEINAWFYSVIDGHGGPLVGVLVRDRISNVMFEHLSKALSTWDASCKSQQEQGISVDPTTLEKRFEAMIQSTLTQAVLALDDIITEIIKEKSIEALKNAYASGTMDGNDNDNNNSSSSFAAKRPHLKPMYTSGIGSPVTPAARKKKILKGIWNSGCCCCFALYLRDRLWVGNLGDCRALLIRRVPDNSSSSSASKPKDQGFQSNMKFTKPMSDNVMHRIREQSKQTPKKRSDQDMSGNQNESLDSDSSKIQVTVLSRDHTCDDPREADDVRRRSGDASAIRWNGGQADPLRVDGTLVPTRAFGNTFLKGYAKEGPDDNYGWPRRSVYITAEPEFIQPAIRLDPSEYPVLVLASDGLWAWTTNDEVGAMIHNGCNAIDLVEVSLELAGKHSGMSVKDLEAREQGKERRMVHDDITVIVIDIFSSS